MSRKYNHALDVNLKDILMQIMGRDKILYFSIEHSLVIIKIHYKCSSNKEWDKKIQNLGQGVVRTPS